MPMGRKLLGQLGRCIQRLWQPQQQRWQQLALRCCHSNALGRPALTYSCMCHVALLILDSDALSPCHLSASASRFPSTWLAAQLTHLLCIVPSHTCTCHACHLLLLVSILAMGVQLPLNSSRPECSTRTRTVHRRTDSLGAEYRTVGSPAGDCCNGTAGCAGCCRGANFGRSVRGAVSCKSANRFRRGTVAVAPFAAVPAAL